MGYQPLMDKRVLVGVCGGIAAYKSVELVRHLQNMGAHPRVVMTRAAQKFVGPLTFEAITGEPVYKDMWDESEPEGIRHIAWAAWADAVVIAPATANMAAKLCHGIADDALSTLMLAVLAPVLICPSMNVHMFNNPRTRANLETLAAGGFFVMAPGSGFLACGDTGPGRLPDPADIVDRLEKMLSPQDLAGKNVLVSAGPTREPLDPVRFISNPSSGRMGFALARAAEHRGASVTLVAGPVHLAPPMNVRMERVETAGQMAQAVFAHAEGADIIIKSAAVGDYRPVSRAEQKIKKTQDSITLTLTKNQDILMELGKRKKKAVLIGFAAETENLADHALEKLRKKNLDMIVANLIGGQDSGFCADTNRVTCFFANGTREPMELMTKDAVAHAILDRAIQLGE